MKLPVSICLTTCNRGHSLPATLDSILQQSFGDFELIISDDCSSDQTQEVCRVYAANDARIRYSRNSRNLRMPGNLNAAISLARGEYIANLHDGDVFDPNLILKWKTALDEVPEAPFVFNPYYWIPWNGTPQLWRKPFDQPGLQPDGPRVAGRTIAAYFFQTLSSCVWGTVMARRSAYEAAGPFDPAFGFISDVDMWLRLARGNTVAYVAEPLMNVREREKTHPYGYFSFQILLWQFAIFARHWPLYQHEMPPEFAAGYRRRLNWQMVRGMISLLRHRQWRRVREGLAVWAASPDPFLKFLGTVAGGTLTGPPAWLREQDWQSVYNFSPRPSGRLGSAVASRGSAPTT